MHAVVEGLRLNRSSVLNNTHLSTRGGSSYCPWFIDPLGGEIEIRILWRMVTKCKMTTLEAIASSSRLQGMQDSSSTSYGVMSQTKGSNRCRAEMGERSPLLQTGNTL